MEFNKCSRCGNFFVSNESVCPKCSVKDRFELSTFKNFVEENGLEGSLDSISTQTGITVKNLNRFLGCEGFEEYSENLGIINKGTIEGNNGITFN